MSPTSEPSLSTPQSETFPTENESTSGRQSVSPSTYQFFTIPTDAPPVPPSPTPEQLAFLESTKSRHSYQSSKHSPSSLLTDHEPPSPTTKVPTILERRQPQRSLATLDTTPKIDLPPGPSTFPQRKSYSSSRDTSISTSAGRFRRTSSLQSSDIGKRDTDDVLTPASSIWSTDAVYRRSLIGNSIINKAPIIEFTEAANAAKRHSDTTSSSKDHEGEPTSDSPEIDFHPETERKIANARLCDVLRTMFGSNGYTT